MDESDPSGKKSTIKNTVDNLNIFKIYAILYFSSARCALCIRKAWVEDDFKGFVSFMFSFPSLFERQKNWCDSVMLYNNIF